MGLKFRNLQVFIEDGRVEETEVAVIKSIRQYITADGRFEEIANYAVADTNAQGNDVAIADRVITIAPPMASEPWLSVYDQAIDLDAMAQVISTAIAGTVVSIDLFDDDWANLRLWKNGTLIDKYSNYVDVDTNTEAGLKEKAEYKGHPQLWQYLFAPGTTTEKLRLVWDDEPFFAQDIIYNTAPLLAMDVRRSSGDSSRFRPNTSLEAGFTQLAFRLSAERRKALTARMEGLPIFDTRFGIAQTILTVGFNTFFLSANVANIGGASKGLRLVFWGEALELGLLELDKVQLRLGASERKDLAVTRSRLEYKPEKGQAADGTLLYYVELPEIEIPAGFINKNEREPGLPYERENNSFADQISLNLFGRGLREGKGKLMLGFTPLSNLDAGQASTKTEITVRHVPTRTPLHYNHAANPYILEQLRNLESSDNLVALVSLDATREECGQLAGEIFEHWNAVLNDVYGDSRKYWLEYKYNPDKLPKTVQLATSQIPQSKRWQEIRTGLPDWVSLYARLESIRDENYVITTTGGFCFDAITFLPPFTTYTDINLALYIGLWVRLKEERPIAQNKIAIQRLVALVNDLMLRGKGIQALVARWNWTPQPWAASATPYEYVRGENQLAEDKNWCKRFLRGVSERLWFGPDLAAHLGQERLLKLADIAEITNIGLEILRVTVPDEQVEETVAAARLRELEQVLAHILPTEQDIKAQLDITRRPRQPSQNNKQEQKS